MHQLTESSVARRHLYRLRTSCWNAEPAEELSRCRLMCLLYVTRSCSVHVMSKWSTCVTNASHFSSSSSTSSICTSHTPHAALTARSNGCGWHSSAAIAQPGCGMTESRCTAESGCGCHSNTTTAECG